MGCLALMKLDQSHLCESHLCGEKVDDETKEKHPFIFQQNYTGNVYLNGGNTSGHGSMCLLGGEAGRWRV